MKYFKRILWLLVAAYAVQVGCTMYRQRAVLVREFPGCKVYHKANTGGLGYFAYVPFAGVLFSMLPKYSQYIFELGDDTTITMEQETPEEVVRWLDFSDSWEPV